MSTTTSQDVRCPRCSASVRAGSDWCTLCYADLRPPPPAPEPRADDTPAKGSGDGSPGDGSPGDGSPGDGSPGEGDTSADAAALPAMLAAGQQGGEGEPPDASAPAVRRGKHARRAPAADAAEVDALAAQLMAQLAVEESGSPLGPLAVLTESSGRKAAVMIGGAGVMIAVLIALMAVVGALV